MWILLCGSDAYLQRAEGVLRALAELGCRTQCLDIWEELDESAFSDEPPAAIVVDAGRAMDAARAALTRLRALSALREVPALVALEVNALQRLSADDAFDDFVLTPVLATELYLRVRRAEWKRSAFSSTERIKSGSLCIDLAAHEVQLDNRVLSFTHQEFQLLAYLAQRPGRALGREELLKEVWGAQFLAGTRTVDIHVRRVRSKLGAYADAVQTVRGVGYRFRH